MRRGQSSNNKTLSTNELNWPTNNNNNNHLQNQNDYRSIYNGMSSISGSGSDSITGSSQSSYQNANDWSVKNRIIKSDCANYYYHN
jgi:tRNA uridine 5-carbamoylmethylation protein Kti12